MTSQNTLLYKQILALLFLAILITGCGADPLIQTENSVQTTDDSDSAKTKSGFYWPTGAPPPIENNWLGSGCDGQTGYFDGLYHIGRDILAPEGSRVYAISSGEVLSVSQNGWGDDNVAILIKHELTTNQQFIAVYGHIRSELKIGDKVRGGMSFATVGFWEEGTHLHFGIRPGNTLAGPYGKMPCPFEGNTNGFVDPIDWITRHSPKIEEVISSSTVQEAAPPPS